VLHKDDQSETTSVRDPPKSSKRALATEHPRVFEDLLPNQVQVLVRVCKQSLLNPWKLA